MAGAKGQQQQQQGNENGLEPSQQPIRYHQFQAANFQLAADSMSGQIDPKNMVSVAPDGIGPDPTGPDPTGTCRVAPAGALSPLHCAPRANHRPLPDRKRPYRPGGTQQLVPTFKNQIAPDPSQPPAQQQPQLEKDRAELEERIERFEERIESLGKLLQRSQEARNHNKVNELQEELSQRKFDLYVAQVHLSAVRSQLQLFEYNFRPAVLVADGSQLDLSLADSSAGPQLASAGGQLVGSGAGGQLGPGGVMVGAGGVGGGQSSRRSPSGASTATLSATPLGYRHKWIKAFKSLKETPGSGQQQLQLQQQQHQK